MYAKIYDKNTHTHKTQTRAELGWKKMYNEKFNRKHFNPQNNTNAIGLPFNLKHIPIGEVMISF